MRIAKTPVSACFLLGILLTACLTGSIYAGTATSISGLYTTGQETSVVNWWQQVDNHWTVTNSANSTYAYVIGSAPSDWSTSTSAGWISASSTGYPGTTVDYSYALTFSINGPVSGAVSNVSITLTLYVDDSATIFVNGTKVTVVSGNSLWTTPTTLTLNSNFKVGSNTIAIAVSNSGGGASGLMVSSITGVVPEMGTWMPIVGALGLVGWIRFRSKKCRLPVAVQ